MRELFGKLVDLDPAASDALRVIEYFDRLVSARAGTTALLKEAAVLARTKVGYEKDGQARTFLPSGSEGTPTPRSMEAIVSETADGAIVWMELNEASVATASMVLDRLALALAVSAMQVEDGASRSAVTILLSPPLPGEDLGSRTAALGKLRLEPNGVFRTLALPLDVLPPPGWPQTLVETPWGRVRGVIARSGFTWNQAGGIGTATDGYGIHESWWRATVALRLSDNIRPFEADSLGSLLVPLQPSAAGIGADELDRVRRALKNRWTTDELAAVADGGSLRRVAAVSGLHHSTITERLNRLPTILGYDPKTGTGRARLTIALMLHRLDEPAPFDRPIL
ncbi:helix-turn-helix domain-containing protein [Promicromonospora vindobonensis]|uniref:Helix-turn-helix domain-containing protein n=1 Tax=Promicromonospora vindobonensis TaxID=195748 RepID=A0ABW5VZM1_9MICO